MKKLISNITQTIKEKRLLFVENNEAKQKEYKEQVGEILTGNKTEINWEKVDAKEGSFMKKVEGWMDEKSSQTPQFRAAVKAAVYGSKGLKEEYKGLKWKTIEQSAITEFKGKMDAALIKLEAQAQLDTVITAKKAAIEKSSANGKTKFVEEFTKGMTLPAGKEAQFKAAIDGAVTKAIEGSDKTTTGYLDSLSKEKDAGAALIRANAVKDTLLANLAVDSSIPELQALAGEQEQYKQALIAIFQKDKLGELLEPSQREGARAKKAISTGTEELAKFFGKASEVKDQTKVIEIVKKVQTDVILSSALDQITTPADQKALLTALGKKETTNFDTIQAKDLKQFLETYASGEATGAADDKQKAIDLILGKVKGVAVIMEGGADAQEYKIVDSKKGNYEALQGVAGELLGHKLAEDLTPQQKIDIKAFKDGGDALAFLKGLKAPDKDRFLGAGGVLNILLSYLRLKDMGGAHVTSGEKGFTFKLNAATKGMDAKQRYSKFSIVSEKMGNGCGASGTVCVDISVTGGGNSTASGPAKGPDKPAKALKLFNAINAKTREITDANSLKEKTAALKAEKDKVVPANVIEDTPEPVATAFKIKTDLKQGETDTINGISYRKEGEDYYVRGGKHPVKAPELSIILGLESPTEAYMMPKVTIDFLKGKPKEIKYNNSNKDITAKYKEGTGEVTVTYNIETGTTTLSAGKNIEALLKDTTPDILAKALYYSLDISKITPSAEVTTKDLEQALRDGKYHDALELIIKVSPFNVSLAARCLELIPLAEIKDITGKATLKTNLTIIIEALKDPIVDAIYGKLLAINDGGPVDLAALLKKKLDKEVIKKLIQIKENQANAALAKLYFTEAFDAATLKGVNIEVLKSYTGDSKDLPKAVIDFIIANYAEIEKQSKGKADSILNAYLALEKYDKATYIVAYEKIYATVFPTDPKIWANYMAAKNKTPDVLAIGIENKAVNNDIAKTFLEALSDKKGVNLVAGAVEKDKPSAVTAKEIVEILKGTTKTTLKLLSARIQEAIKLIDDKYTDSPEAERIQARLAIINDKTVPSLERIQAINEFLEKGKFEKTYKPENVSLDDFHKDLKTKKAELLYVNFQLSTFPDELKPLLLPESRRKFIDVYKAAITAPQKEEDIKSILDKKDEIGVDQLLLLAKSHATKLTNKQKIDIYTALSLKGEATGLINGLVDGPEKKFLQARLEENKGKKADLLGEAYRELGTVTVDYAIQTEIIKAYHAAIKDSGWAEEDVRAHLNEMDKAPSTVDNLAKATGTTDAQKEAILTARMIRAQIELGECENTPEEDEAKFKSLPADEKANLAAQCEPNDMVKECHEYLTGKGGDYDKDFVGLLKGAVAARGGYAALDATSKGKYKEIMLKTATQTKDQSYLDGIDQKDLTGSAGAEALDLQGKFFEAAEAETDLNKKFKYLEKAEGQTGVDKAKLAAEYAKVITPENGKKAQKRAAELYVELTKWTDATTILKDPAKVDEATAAEMITKFPAGQPDKILEIARAWNFYDIELGIFKDNKEFSITIEAINAGISAAGAHKVTAASVLEALKTHDPSGKKVEGDKALRIAFAKDNWGSIKDLDKSVKDKILANLDITEAEVLAALAGPPPINDPEVDVIVAREPLKN